MPFVTSELANHGVTFTSGQVSTALCAPSRASILRAQYAHRTGVLENRPPDGGADVFDATSTVATWLQNAGYRTGFVGKYLNGYNRLAPCIPPGWEEWHAQVKVNYYDYDLDDDGVVTHFGRKHEDYSGDVMNQRALEFIKAIRRSSVLPVARPEGAPCAGHPRRRVTSASSTGSCRSGLRTTRRRT